MEKIVEVNAITGEQNIRDMTPEEITEREAVAANREARKQAQAEKQAKLDSAKAKLAALGLDEAEVNAILGL